VRGTTGIAIRELAGFGLYSKQIEVTAKTISAFWRCLRRWLWSLTFQSPEFLIKGPLGNILAFVWSKSNHFLARTRHDTQTNEPQTDRQTDRRTVPNGPCPKKQYLPCYRNQGLIIIGCTLLQSCDTARQYFCIRWNDYWREEYGWERNSQYQLYSFVQRWSSVYIFSFRVMPMTNVPADFQLIYTSWYCLSAAWLLQIVCYPCGWLMCLVQERLAGLVLIVTFVFRHFWTYDTYDTIR